VGALALIMLTSRPGAPRLVETEHQMFALLLGSPSPIGAHPDRPIARLNAAFGIAREGARCSLRGLRP